jgi:hypothetical protein
VLVYSNVCIHITATLGAYMFMLQALLSCIIRELSACTPHFNYGSTSSSSSISDRTNTVDNTTNAPTSLHHASYANMSLLSVFMHAACHCNGQVCKL